MATGLWCSKCVYFQMLSVCCFFHLAFGGQVRELTKRDLRNIGHSTKMNFITVFFDRPATGKADTRFLRAFEKSSKTLQAYGIELAKVSCEGKSIPQCTSIVQRTYLYKNGESSFQEEFPVSHMFNVDAIVSNLLHVTLVEEYQYIGDEQALSELLSTGLGKKDVLFCYVKALGTTAHRHFLEVVSHSKQQTLFALTTDASVAKKFGVSTQGDAAVTLFHCKEEMLSASECRTTRYEGKIDKVHLAQFVQAQMLPKYVILPSSKTTVYDSLPVRLNKAFVFTDKISDLPHDQLEQMAVEFQGSLGIIVVDINDHKDILQSFGLAENNNLPTAAFVPVIEKKKNVTYVELYPETAALFSISNFKRFIKPMIERPSEEYTRIADSTSLLQLSYAEYADAMKGTDTNYLLANDFLVIAFCNEDYEPCKKFSPTYRRIVRTFDRVGERGITLAHVKTALHNKKFEGESFPVVRLHLTKSSTEYIQYTDKLGYDELMDFIADHTGVPRPLSLPPSLSDLPPISIQPADEDADFPVEEENDEEETETDSRYNAEDDSLPAEETEDDEVAAAVLQAPSTVVPEDLVPTLTDKTFDVTKETHDLLVVDFYQPWDPRSRAFVQPYVDAATSLGGFDVGEFSIKLARVNCFDWNDVCEKNNITRYPTIKMFRKGSNELIYKGPLDSDHVTKAALLLQPSVPFSLGSKEEVNMFLEGKLPKLAEKATDTAVLGMFPDGNDKAFKAFESSAVTLRSKFLFGYITGETAQRLSADYGLSLPAIILFKRNDPYQPIAFFTDRFTPEFITDFTRFSSIPSFDELTPLNLPTYLAHQRPLLIVFRANNEEAMITPVMTEIAGDREALPSVFLCWMPVQSETDLNAEILEAYTGSKSGLPALVLLNHDKGAVYQFKGEVTKPAVVTWVKRVLGGKEQPSSLLKDGEWKPLLEGYDFLRMIDEEEEAEKRKTMKRRRVEETLEIEDEEVWQQSTPDTEESEHKTSHSRDEL